MTNAELYQLLHWTGSYTQSLNTIERRIPGAMAGPRAPPCSPRVPSVVLYAGFVALLVAGGALPRSIGVEASSGAGGGSSTLYAALDSLTFLNNGTVHSTDRFNWQGIPCLYLEPDNVTTTDYAWAARGSCPYMFQEAAPAPPAPCNASAIQNGVDRPGGDYKAYSLPAPATAQACQQACCDDNQCASWVFAASAPGNFKSCTTGENCCYLKSTTPATKPLAGVSSGTVAPKPPGVSPPLGMRSAAPLGGLGSGSVELRGDGTLREWTILNQSPAGAAKFGAQQDALFGVFQGTSSGGVAKVLQTSPRSANTPGVSSITYHGATPVSRLDINDASLPLTTTLYGYSTMKVGDMNTSARPAAAFSLNVEAAGSVKPGMHASFLFTLPFSIEQDTQRAGGTVIGNTTQTTAESCGASCAADVKCASWTWFETMCLTYGDAPLNAFKLDSYSGVSGTWTTSTTGGFTCLSLDRPGVQAPHGNISLCGTASGGAGTASYSFATADTVDDLWAAFAKGGALGNNVNPTALVGAMVVTVPLSTAAPSATLTISMSHYFPNRDFKGVVLGNFYKHLWADSVDVGTDMLSNLETVVADIHALHDPLLDSSVPDWLADSIVNSLHHFRSGMWYADGRWRQWEAYDCVNIDSVHNDGERHIPYIMLFPDTVRNKISAWGNLGQLSNGMIDEQLGCGCTSAVPQLDDACGRVMSDVSSMYIQYVYELYKWNNDTALLKASYPHVKKAALWHISTCDKYGVPYKLQTTYDVLGFNQYDYAAYSSVFHLLAMASSRQLALEVGDTEFAAQCFASYTRAQAALDSLSWNATAKHYNAYAGGSAIFSDTFYAQVLAYSAGLGNLTANPTFMDLHLQTTLEKNDSPNGVIIQTGRYEYPGPAQDNSIWQMAPPDIATLQIHRGVTDVATALEQPMKAINMWREGVKDNWAVAGVAGGIDQPQTGMPWITSHYGYYMVHWHILLALSGQNADLPSRSLTFDPKLPAPYSLPVLMPGRVGTVSFDGTTYTVALTVGTVSVDDLFVGTSQHPGPVTIAPGSPASWPAKSQ